MTKQRTILGSRLRPGEPRDRSRAPGSSIADVRIAGFGEGDAPLLGGGDDGRRSHHALADRTQHLPSLMLTTCHGRKCFWDPVAAVIPKRLVQLATVLFITTYSFLYTLRSSRS